MLGTIQGDQALTKVFLPYYINIYWYLFLVDWEIFSRTVVLLSLCCEYIKISDNKLNTSSLNFFMPNDDYKIDIQGFMYTSDFSGSRE